MNMTRQWNQKKIYILKLKIKSKSLMYTSKQCTNIEHYDSKRMLTRGMGPPLILWVIIHQKVGNVWKSEGRIIRGHWWQR